MCTVDSEAVSVGLLIIECNENYLILGWLLLSVQRVTCLGVVLTFMKVVMTGDAAWRELLLLTTVCRLLRVSLTGKKARIE